MLHRELTGEVAVAIHGYLRAKACTSALGNGSVHNQCSCLPTQEDWPGRVICHTMTWGAAPLQQPTMYYTHVRSALLVARAVVSKSISTGQGKARTDWQRIAEGGEGGEGDLAQMHRIGIGSSRVQSS